MTFLFFSFPERHGDGVSSCGGSGVVGLRTILSFLPWPLHVTLYGGGGGGGGEGYDVQNLRRDLRFLAAP